MEKQSIYRGLKWKIGGVKALGVEYMGSVSISAEAKSVRSRKKQRRRARRRSKGAVVKEQRRRGASLAAVVVGGGVYGQRNGLGEVSGRIAFATRS